MECRPTSNQCSCSERASVEETAGRTTEATCNHHDDFDDHHHQQTVHIAEVHRIAISKLVNGDPAPEHSKHPKRLEVSAEFSSPRTLNGSWTRTCPSCGSDITSGIHSHGSPDDSSDSAALWQDRLSHWRDLDASSAVMVGGKNRSCHSPQRCATPSPATVLALNPFANSAVPFNRRMSLNLDYCMRFHSFYVSGLRQ